MLPPFTTSKPSQKSPEVFILPEGKPVLVFVDRRIEGLVGFMGVVESGNFFLLNSIRCILFFCDFFIRNSVFCRDKNIDRVNIYAT